MKVSIQTLSTTLTEELTDAQYADLVAAMNTQQPAHIIVREDGSRLTLNLRNVVALELAAPEPEPEPEPEPAPEEAPAEEPAPEEPSGPAPEETPAPEPASEETPAPEAAPEAEGGTAEVDPAPAAEPAPDPEAEPTAAPSEVDPVSESDTATPDPAPEEDTRTVKELHAALRAAGIHADHHAHKSELLKLAADNGV